MSRLIQCDRCGEIFKSFGPRGGIISNKSMDFFSYPDRDASDKGQLELCEVCGEGAKEWFAKWINEMGREE